MGVKTEIQWCDSTLNLEMGCDGCELWSPAQRSCYAGTQTERMLRGGALKGWPQAFNKPEIFAYRMDEAERWKDLTGTARPDKPWLDFYPRLIFLNDMGDTFTESLPFKWLAPFLPRMAATPHVYQLLTKRPCRAAKFFRDHPCPHNVWVGTSITGPGSWSRVLDLCEVKCSVRFISYEPAWASVFGKVSLWTGQFQWVVIGGQSGREARPFNTRIIDDAVRVFGELGVKVFIKQLGANPYYAHCPGGLGKMEPLKDSHGGDWNEWPGAWRVREMPAL